MKYGKEHKSGIKIDRDSYADHWSLIEDIRTNYMVYNDFDCLDEDEDAQALAKRLQDKADRLNQIANFLRKIGVSKRKKKV